MTAEQPIWNIDDLTPEARRAAEDAAAAAGISVETWLNQLIKYVSAMELSEGEGRETMEAAVENRMAEVMAGGADDTANDTDPPAAQRDEPVQAAGDADAPPSEEQPSLIPEVTGPAPGWTDGGDEGEETFMGLVAIDAVDLPANALRPDRAEVQAAIAAAQKTGSLEPLVVRRVADDRDAYEVVTGADRLEAARKLRRDEVPVIVRAMSDDEAERAALVDRIKRRRMPAVEEARALGRLAQEAGLDAEALSALVHRPVREVQDALDLLRLPDAVLKMIERGELTIVHARTLTRAADPEALANEVIARRLDIYQTEQLVVTSGGRPRYTSPQQARQAEPAPGAGGSDDDVVETQLLERHLSALLGLKVTITERSDVGMVAIHYVSRDQLNHLISRLNTVSGT